MFTVYFAMFFDGYRGISTMAILATGIVVLVLVLARQVQMISRDDHPTVRAVEALGIAIPLLVVVFASAYVAVTRSDPAAFSERLSRGDAVYFTITTLATVGYGDITPVSDVARLIASIQMLLDLVLIGALVRVLFGAAQHTLARRADDLPDPAPGTEPTP